MSGLDLAKVLAQMVGQLRIYIDKYRLSSLVLGLSGGIDSTVVAAVACLACHSTSLSPQLSGRCRLIGVHLPSATNQPAEQRTARAVGQAFCDQLIEQTIDDLYQCTSQRLEQVFQVGTDPSSSATSPLALRIAQGNLKARLRMIYLYHIAALQQGIVLDTDNRTEHELGFWTIHGDVGDYNPGLIYLWKSEVYALAEYLLDQLPAADQLNSSQRAALCAAMQLAPTDGNGVSCSDVEQIGGSSYQEIDAILRACLALENQFAPSAGDQYDAEQLAKMVEQLCQRDGFTRDTVTKVLSRHYQNQFKRRSLPFVPPQEAIV